MKLLAGQHLYREKPQRGRSWGVPIEREVEQVTVATVGSKYFTLAEDKDYRYLKTTLRDEYAHQPALRLTAEEITDEWERTDLQRELRRVLEYTHVPLATLRQISELVPEQLQTIRKPLPAL